MDSWECKVCGYVYNPKLGNPDNGIAPQTPFEELPEKWACPVVGAPKIWFKKKQ